MQTDIEINEKQPNLNENISDEDSYGIVFTCFFLD